jgi:hypothetical protein
MPTERISRIAARIALAIVLAAGAAQAAETPSRELAPGFTSRPAGARILVMPPDLELFSISAGGITEPRADWTDAAGKHFAAAIAGRKDIGDNRLAITEAQLDDHAEMVALHRAVAEAIWVHHIHSPKLPTKSGHLDWTMGSVVKPLREKTGADYALFFWVRDTYASNERKLAILALALMGSFALGGEQNAYASLVDLATGRVVWFNDVRRMSGDLREPQSAAETVDALLQGFPKQQ